MSASPRQCLICNCEATQKFDFPEVAAAIGAGEMPTIHHQLCRAQLGNLQEAAATGQPLLVACAQEAALFSEVASEVSQEIDIRTLDIRHAAGWSKDGHKSGPKIAALLAEATLPVPAVPVVEMESAGRCLIAGPADQVLEAAGRLAAIMEVTALIESGGVSPLDMSGTTLIAGRLVRATGHLGKFEVLIEDAAMPKPSGRGALVFEAARKELNAEFDCILDIRGGPALVQAPMKRDGYVKADPSDPLAVQRALFDAAQFIGSFQKPRYVAYDESLCAHSRSKRVGCHRCLDHCPTGAITPNGDHVAIDPFVCAGCGSCAALCPSGAIVYDNPSPNHLSERIRVLLRTFRDAGGERPILLLVDHRHGEGLIEAMARFGDGLPAHVIPVRLSEVTQLPLELMLSAVAYGALGVVALLPWQAAPEALALQSNIGYANAIFAGLGFGDSRIELLFEDDPDALAARLWQLEWPAHAAASGFLAMGGKRERLRMALDALHANSTDKPDTVALPQGAPLGNVVIDVEGCTLCLACVGACPTGALIDNPDAPMLRFLEDACIQCGLCQNTCPEKVIKLEPRVSFLVDAKSPRLVKEEEPAHCVRCNKPFGVQSSVDKIVTSLANKHSMFATADQIQRLRMCEDCRVVVQFEVGDNPMQAGPRPTTRTTDDYLREREEIEQARANLPKKP